MELSVAEGEAVRDEKPTLDCLFVLWFCFCCSVFFGCFFNYYFISKETQQQRQKVLSIQQ